MTVTAPGQPPLCVPLARVASPQQRGVTVWDWAGTADDEGDDAAAWFTAVVGTPVRLVRFAASAQRLTSAKYPPTGPTVFRRVRAIDRVGAAPRASALTPPLWPRRRPFWLSDGYPVLILGEASMADLNARLAAAEKPPLPINRFRANVTVAGSAPFDEDDWDELSIGAVRFRSVKPCSRCKARRLRRGAARGRVTRAGLAAAAAGDDGRPGDGRRGSGAAADARHLPLRPGAQLAAAGRGGLGERCARMRAHSRFVKAPSQPSGPPQLRRRRRVHGVEPGASAGARRDGGADHLSRRRGDRPQHEEMGRLLPHCRGVEAS